MLEPHRFLKLAMCTSTMVVFVWTGSALAGTRTVTNTSDSGPGSLRDAIAVASPGDTINFKLTYPAEIDLSSTLSITKSLTIYGPGAANLAINGPAGPTNAQRARVFSVSSGVIVAMFGATIENGYSVTGAGGGIHNEGTLTISSSTVQDNQAFPPCSPICLGGGGIYNTGRLFVSDSTISGNRLSGFGGGIYNDTDGTAFVTDCTFTNNQSFNDGGAAIFNAGTLTVTSSTLSEQGTEDGTIYNTGILSITGSTLSQNSGHHKGGGIYNNGTATVSSSIISDHSAKTGPGGIYNDTAGTMSLTNVTLSGNSSLFGNATAIYNLGTLSITSSTISGNPVGQDSPTGVGALYNLGTLTVKSTIFANSVSSQPDVFGVPQVNCFGTAGTSAGFNLSDDDSCDFAGVGDLNSTPAGLDPNGLQNNGGPTETVALLPTSPAVDAIPVNYCTALDGTPIATDQRGIPRPQGQGCDIGAYEYLPIMGPTPSSGITCNGAYNGTFSGNITVSVGQNCIFFNGEVTGNVQQIGGSLVLFQSQVGGDVQIKGESTFSIGPGSAVNGNLQIQDLPSGSGQNLVCGSNVQGDLQFQNNGTAVLIGALAPVSCAGNTIGGSLQVQTNSASTTIVGNTITGNLQDQANKGLTQVFLNIVSGNLQCGNNTAITGGGNIAGQKQGQCVGF